MFVTAIIFIVILSLLVFIHELGHFMVAKWVGVKVEEFGLGIPPRVFGKKFKETIYSLNWFPIGGFVKLAGEDDPTSLEASLGKVKNKKQYFWFRSKKERAAILLAGVTMNFLLAVGVTAYLLIDGVKEPAGRVHVERVVTGSPAQQAGVKVGDVIERVATLGNAEVKAITTTSQLITVTRAHVGEPLTLTLSRGGQELSIVLIPRKEFPKDQGPMGVAISDLEVHRYPWFIAPWKALVLNVVRARDMLWSMVVLVARLVSLQPVAGDVAGPIGIAQVTGQAVRFGWRAVLEFMSILSLNLAVLNVLPIPALDGGRLAFVVFEKILGRKVHPAFERSAHQIGMIILLVLILLVSLNDILRLTRGG